MKIYFIKKVIKHTAINLRNIYFTCIQKNQIYLFNIKNILKKFN